MANENGQSGARQKESSGSSGLHSDVFAVSPIAILCEDWSDIYAAVRAIVDRGENFDDHLRRNSECIYELRRMHRFVDANESALRLLGVGSLLELKNNSEILPADPRGTVIRAMAAGLSFCQGERDFRNNRGIRIQILWRANLPVVHSGFERLYFFAVDVSEQKQAQEALDVARSNLDHAGRLSFVGELSASLAHEVSQPINTIGNLAEAANRWLRRDRPNIEEAAAAIERISGNAKHAAQVVHRMRNFVKRRKTELETLSPSALIEEAAAMMALEIKRQAAVLEVEVAPQLPQVRVDPTQIQQVIVNLLANSLQAMAAAGITDRRISIRCQRTREGISTSIADTGPGIPPEVVERVLEPFFTTKADGLGLGLSISRRIIEDHGGALRISASGRGGSAVFTLPVNATTKLESTEFLKTSESAGR